MKNKDSAIDFYKIRTFQKQITTIKKKKKKKRDRENRTNKKEKRKEEK